MAKPSRKQDKTTTEFAKMGTEASNAAVATDPSPNLKFRPRGGAKSNAPVGTKSAPGRAPTQERLGFQGAPQVSMMSPNNVESGSVGRNVRLVPSAIGNRDFYLKRQYGQTGNFG